MQTDTKFYKVTEAIVANYDIYMAKGLKNSQIGELHNIPSGVVAHIMRTLYIVKGNK